MVTVQERPKVEVFVDGRPATVKDLFDILAAEAAAVGVAEKPGYEDGWLSLNSDALTATVEGQAVRLTPKELQLLTYLVNNRHRVIPHTELLLNVWGSIHFSLESVKWHIASLRRKIEADPPCPVRVVTVWGVGYRYVAPGEAWA